MYRQIRFAVTFAVALGTVAYAAQQQRPAVQAPTFRSAITLVPVDVRVVDNSGRPITDLKQEDFTIFEDGVPQTIRNFATVSFTANQSASGSQLELRGAAQTAQAADNRRVFLIVMGRGRHQDVSKYVDAIADYVGRILPQDHVALMAWNRATDFTTDHEVVRRTLVKYRNEHAKIEAELNAWFSSLRGLYGPKGIPPHIQKMIDDVFSEAAALRPRPLAPAAVAEGQRAADEVRRTAENLQRNAEINERVAGGFKTAPDLEAALAAGSGMDFDQYVAMMTETLQDTGNLYAAIGYLRFLAGEKHLVFVTRNGVSLPRQEGNASLARIAADARIALDLIHTGGGVGLPPPIFLPGGGLKIEPWATTTQVLALHGQIQDLQLMADRTGGQLMAFKTGEDAMRRLEETIKFQYLLGYTPSRPKPDGTFRKLTVKVNRPGARVVAREGYVATEQPLNLDRRELITFNRIRAAAEYPSVVDHLKVKLGRPVAAARSVDVEVSVDISRVKFSAVDGRREATLEVALFCGGEKDAQVGEVTKRIELRYAEADFARALKDGVKFRLTATLRSPAKNIKVVVYDYAADLVGSAVAETGR